MGLNAQQFVNFLGVDSRANPLAQPFGSFCRERNWITTPDHHLRLRDGYTAQTMSALPGSGIHSMFGFDYYTGSTVTRYLIFGAANVLYLLNIATGTVTTPPVRGAAITTSNPWTFAVADDGKLYCWNGSTNKFFDGSAFRDIGLRAPTAAEVSGTHVAIGSADPNGIAPSEIGGAQPGYQFAVAIYNPTTGHVGNYINIGTRLAPTVASDFNITGLPNYAGTDTEWVLLIGRTIDGGEIPYIITDASGNWIYAASGVTSITITQPDIDQDSAMPTRNYQPPQSLNLAAWVGDRFYAGSTGSATIYKGAADADATIGAFVGRWEQCFDPADIETFPTGEGLVAINAYGGDAWCQSEQSTAVMVETPSGFQWQGPYNVGIAGRLAFCSTPYGPMWVSKQKQICTMTESGGGVPVSGQYDQALLGNIGDAYVSAVFMAYEVDPARQIERVVVKAVTAALRPFHVYHDFKLRSDPWTDSSSYPWEGRGYDTYYQGDLANDHLLISAKDSTGYLRTWAASVTTRKIYQLWNGGDDGGTPFTADGVFLVNAGPNKPTVPYIEWYGDGNLDVAVAQELNATLSGFTDITSSLESTWDDSTSAFHYRVTTNPSGTNLTSEQKYLYVRIQLTSHPTDGNLSLNDPPHVPLENYGRVYMVAVEPGNERGATP